MIFETERLLIRQFTEADEENFFRLNSDPEVMRYIRQVKTREDCKAFLLQNIASYIIRPKMGRWAMLEKSTGIFTGSFAIIPIENTADIQLGYALLKEHWGKGYATESTVMGKQFAFETLNLDIIYAITEAPNIASQNVLLKTGFTRTDNRYSEGKELFVYYAKRVP